MRIVAAIFVLLLAPAAWAQTPVLDRIDVNDYGIYTADTTGQEAVQGTATGSMNIVRNIKQAVATRTVPAQLGVRFGYHFTPVGSPDGASVQLHHVVIFPSPGLRNPDNGQTNTRDEYDTTKKIGVEAYTGYKLENDWELVPGVWTFQIWYQGKKLAEQSFTVVKQ